MICPPNLRAAGVVFLALGSLAAPARALVTLNDGTDKIYASGTFTMGYDSNISASADNTSDTTVSANLGLEYQRHAGLIAVNANASFAINRYLNNTTYNSVNPSYSLEFDKASGRTTGTLNFGAVRSSQADAAVNFYTTAWNYSADLNVHYPVIDRYSFAGSLDYGFLDYTETSNQPLVNLSTYSSSLSLFYVLSGDRDLFATYRYRFEQSSISTSTTDDALNLGMHGKLIWEIKGSLSVGYQIRDPRGTSFAGAPQQSSYHDLTSQASASWMANRKLTFNGSLSKDFATTATDATTDTTAGTLDVTYVLNAVLSANAGLGGGENRFLGPAGFVPGTTKERRDYYFTWNAGVSYTFNERLHVSLAYVYFQNWSNLGFAVFNRNRITLSLSSRW